MGSFVETYIEPWLFGGLGVLLAPNCFSKDSELIFSYRTLAITEKIEIPAEAIEV